MNMKVCPLCNGLKQPHIVCTTCNNEMQNTGRIYDFFDEYSAYMDIESMKLVDGVTSSGEQEQCSHLFYCDICKASFIKKILLEEC
ncbi:hypothetical protein WAK64_04975 [Bacillus spongiae]|uniref:DUF2757 family protein n=1 Tax=Bacillus spongiae TaxID=2683610 RepID=A0ABU8HAZ3_9BACI